MTLDESAAELAACREWMKRNLINGEGFAYPD